MVGRGVTRPGRGVGGEEVQCAVFGAAVGVVECQLSQGTLGV
jgi:hypothetical protein